MKQTVLIVFVTLHNDKPADMTLEKEWCELAVIYMGNVISMLYL